MKIKYLFLTLAAALIAGCSDDLDRSGAYNPEKGVTASIPTYSFDGGTRVNISDDLQTFTWSDGDEIGLYYQDSGSTAHAGFTILAGGGSTGTFVNEAFRLKSSSTYYAFYPFAENAIIASAPVDFTGQVQTANGSASHLGGYNFMYTTVNTDASGDASIQFKNLGSVMQLQLTVSNAATYTDIYISSDGAEFITKGTANMADGNITATETSATIHLGFESGITLNAGDVLTANILVAPVDMSGSTLTITLTDTEEKTYEVTTAGKNMLQGKAYLYEGTMIDDSTVPYVTFTAVSEQTLQMTQAVSTLEYSVNGGNWTELGTAQVTFGGSYGNLRLRGKNIYGTAIDFNNNVYSTIQFGNASEVNCTGDIRTLIDYENYSTVDTSNARFFRLFYGCTSLTQAPVLPATTLADYCYFDMFYGCTALTQAPELPATTLAYYCYGQMFYGCTSLTQAPELPATNLAGGCYTTMFMGCTSLTQAPELHATNLVYRCYYGMFSGCTALTQTPELPVTNLAEDCYAAMFSYCTALTQAPELPATNLATRCYNFMFSGCTSLTQAPELPATTLAYYCYEYMFERCTSLTQAPELPATNLAGGCYEGMFYGCTSLTQAPELPATTIAYYCYSQMFYGCTSLTQAPELPATTLFQSCYSSMFGRCTSLTQAPELPATNLAEWCYYGMFNGCTNLNYIKMMATDISASNCLNNWVKGVSSTGTFVKNKDATWDVTGTSGIPESWTVITE